MTEAIGRASAGDWLYDLLLDSPNLHAFVQDFTSTLHDSMSSDPGAIWCSVTVLRNKRGATMASSNDWIHELDVKQYEFGDGPCLTAAAEQTPQYIPDVTAEERWPELMQLAADAGVSSILAFPFDLSDEASACFNIYFDDQQAYDESFRSEIENILHISSKGLRLAVRLAQHEETQHDLDAAMRSRTTINLAVGIIMGQNRCSQQEAFEVLSKTSSNRNIKVRDLAAELVKQVGQAPGETHFER